MKINIYYGGRGMMDDPTLYVLNQFETVLNELNVRVERFNLHEMKTKITSLPASINDADGIVLASTVEWYGIGGYMTQFLDACWLYGNGRPRPALRSPGRFWEACPAAVCADMSRIWFPLN